MTLSFLSNQILSVPVALVARLKLMKEWRKGNASKKPNVCVCVCLPLGFRGYLIGSLYPRFRLKLGPATVCYNAEACMTLQVSLKDA